ncbi:MAG: type II secretion system protein [Planctomycetota bacterium]
MSVRRGRGQRGFSLIEILVVITIIGLLMTLAFGPVQNALDAGKVTKCMTNLRGIGQSLSIYVNQRNKGRWPTESGMRFLLVLHKHGELKGKNSEIFLCPGTGDRNDLGASGEDGSSYDDWETIDSATISYAGRDQANHPVRGSDLAEVIIAADDNEFGGNHRSITNYLHANGSVRSYDIEIEGEDLLKADPSLERSGLPVGPNCPWEPLQVLRVD